MKFPVLALSALILAACTSTPNKTHNHNHSATQTNQSATSHSSSSREFECNNGLMVNSSMVNNGVRLSVQYGSPQAAVAVLSRQGNSYSGSGLFGGNATWQENGNNATFSYINNGQMVQTNCVAQ